MVKKHFGCLVKSFGKDMQNVSSDNSFPFSLIGHGGLSKW